MTQAFQHLRELLGAPGSTGFTDGDLLERFASHRDEAAFAELLRRHGAMVLSVCRSLLRQTQDAEDAFQATSWSWPAGRGRSKNPPALATGSTESPVARRGAHAGAPRACRRVKSG